MTERFTFKMLNLNLTTKEKRELDRVRKLQNKFVEDMINKQNQEVEKLFKKSLKHIFPPIKGEITKGKLRWRGISLCEKIWNALPKRVMREVWFTQRGIRISNILQFMRPKLINN